MNLRSLLQDADPLRHEAPRLDAERDRIRRTILDSKPMAPAKVAASPRRTLVAALAVIGLVGAALGYQMWAHGSSAVLAAVRFEARFAEEQPIPGLTVAEIADSGRVIYLHPEIVVNNDDIVQSWVVEDGPNLFGVAVELSPSGAERMRQATSSHIGRPIAILIDGAVATAPVVRSPISNSAVISGNYSRGEARRIADGIH